MVTHLLAFGLSACVILVATTTSFSFFSWHPILMTIAFALLATEAIAIFDKSSSLVLSASRSAKINYHSYILLVAYVISFVGFWVIYSGKNASGKPHFVTYHAIGGLVTVVYSAAQIVAGIGLKYGSSIRRYLPRWATMARWKITHSVSGLCLYILACLTLLAGFNSNWFVNNTNYYVANGCNIGSVILIACSANHMRQILYPKRSSPSSVAKN